MDYTEFKEEIKNRIKVFLPEKFQDYRVDILPIRKNNGVVKDGLVIGERNLTVPAIHLNDFYENYKGGSSLEDIMAQIAADYKRGLETYSGFGTELLEYDKAKEYLTVTVCNAEKNTELLKKVPHEKREDLALVYRVKRQLPDQGTESVIVNYGMLRHWDIGEQELKSEAWSRMKMNNSPSFRSMDEVMHDFFPDGLVSVVGDGAEPFIPLYVLTNKEEMWGAAYMFDQETMAGIAEKMGQSLIILPSSLHEVLIIPETENVDVEELQDMVKSINKNEVEEQDVLSNHVYRFDKDRQTLSMLQPPEQTQGMSMNF